MTTIQCPDSNCGKENPEDSKYCSECGTHLTDKTGYLSSEAIIDRASTKSAELVFDRVIKWIKIVGVGMTVVVFCTGLILAAYGLSTREEVNKALDSVKHTVGEAAKKGQFINQLAQVASEKVGEIAKTNNDARIELDKQTAEIRLGAFSALRYKAFIDGIGVFRAYLRNAGLGKAHCPVSIDMSRKDDPNVLVYDTYDAETDILITKCTKIVLNGADKGISEQLKKSSLYRAMGIYFPSSFKDMPYYVGGDGRVIDVRTGNALHQELMPVSPPLTPVSPPLTPVSPPLTPVSLPLTPAGLQNADTNKWVPALWAIRDLIGKGHADALISTAWEKADKALQGKSLDKSFAGYLASDKNPGLGKKQREEIFSILLTAGII